MEQQSSPGAWFIPKFISLAQMCPQPSIYSLTAQNHDLKHYSFSSLPSFQTTYKGQSYFEAYNDYQKWEAFMEEVKTQHLDPQSPLQGMYQTSEFWKDVSVASFP